MPCGPGDDSFPPVQCFLRTQLLVRVCFVININKAQGQSFSGALALYLRGNVFSHGLYDGPTKATRPKLFLVLCPTNPLTRNVVSPEVLQN